MLPPQLPCRFRARGQLESEAPTKSQAACKAVVVRSLTLHAAGQQHNQVQHRKDAILPVGLNTCSADITLTILTGHESTCSAQRCAGRQKLLQHAHCHWQGVTRLSLVWSAADRTWYRHYWAEMLNFAVTGHPWHVTGVATVHQPVGTNLQHHHKTVPELSCHCHRHCQCSAGLGVTPRLGPSCPAARLHVIRGSACERVCLY